MSVKYEIRKSFYHKDYVMLLSVVQTLTGTSAMWSTHEWFADTKTPIDVLASLFQKEHERQIDKMIQEEFLNEPEEFKHKTVQDITDTNEKL